MDFLQLFSLIRRRWLYGLVPAVVVLIATIVTAEESVVPAPVYTVGVRFLVAPPLLDEADADNPLRGEEEERYYQWLTSEYVVNGMADWVNSIDFAERVSAKVAEQGVEIDPIAIFNATNADAIRSRLTLSLTYGDEAQLEALIAAAIDVILTESGDAIPHAAGEDAAVTQLDRPVVNAIAPPITGQLDLPLRIVLALIVGVVIAFAADFLNLPVFPAVRSSIRSAADLEALGVDVLQEIPGGGR